MILKKKKDMGAERKALITENTNKCRRNDKKSLFCNHSYHRPEEIVQNNGLGFFKNGNVMKDTSFPSSGEERKENIRK